MPETREPVPVVQQPAPITWGAVGVWFATGVVIFAGQQAAEAVWRWWRRRRRRPR